MNEVLFFACYDYNPEFYLIEMMVDCDAQEIEFGSFCTPDPNLDRMSWQVAYMVQYLNATGTEKLYDDFFLPPDVRLRPCRVAFYIFKTRVMTLSTPFGSFSLSDAQPVPERLKKIIEFEELD